MANNKKKKLEKTQFYIFLAVLVIPTISWLMLNLVSLADPRIMESIDYDLGENRNLAKYPEEFSGDYFAKVEKYYNDRVPFRSLLIDLNSIGSEQLEKPYENGMKDKLIAWLHGDEEETTTQPAETTTVDFGGLFGEDTSDEVSEPENEYSQEYTSEEIPSIETLPVETDEEPTEITEPPIETVVPTGSETEPITEAPTVQTLPPPPPTTESTTVQTISPTEPKRPSTSPIEQTSQSVVNGGLFPDTPDENMTGYMPPVVKNDYVVLGRGDWLFLYGYSNIGYYLDEKHMSEATMKSRTEKLKQLNKVCASKGKKLVVMIPPNKDQVYSEYMPSYEVESDYKSVHHFVDYVKEHSEVMISYPIAELNYIKKYYQAYFKYDTHWNYIGAFVGEQIILQMLGLPTTNILNLQITAIPWSSGDLIGAGGLNASKYTSDYSYSIWYKPEVQISDKSGDLNGVFREISNAPNKQKLVMIGDSFKNHIRDIIYKDFADCTMVNYEILKGGSGDASIKAADVVVVVFVERDECYLDGTIEYLTKILS